ncbi:MAG: hypothetical protein ACKVIS_23860, partial [Pseudomonadales bacterium]
IDILLKCRKHRLKANSDRTVAAGSYELLTPARHRSIMKKSAQVVGRHPAWVNPPEPGQDLRDLEWGVVEVMSDKSLRFTNEKPDPEALEKLIDELEDLI